MVFRIFQHIAGSQSLIEDETDTRNHGGCFFGDRCIGKNHGETKILTKLRPQIICFWGMSGLHLPQPPVQVMHARLYTKASWREASNLMISTVPCCKELPGMACLLWPCCLICYDVYVLLISIYIHIYHVYIYIYIYMCVCVCICIYIYICICCGIILYVMYVHV